MEIKHNCIGLMSGTSLDGLDIACCSFELKDRAWSYKIVHAETREYTKEWKSKLSNAHLMSGIDLSLLHVDLGKLHGNWIDELVQRIEFDVDFIASHGHTVFHQPDRGLTLQIGSAPHIASICKLPVIADFRTTDVANGGHGAPLVPIGDLLLFSQYTYCLNLGGIANISFDRTTSNNEVQRIAYDVCICNIVLNYVAERLGLEYDSEGSLAASGTIDNWLLEELNRLDFYKEQSPKSLGKEYFETKFLPLIQDSEIAAIDILATLVEHISLQIANAIKGDSKDTLLITGGGALNNFLIESLGLKTTCKIIVPDQKTIQFKEALIFAFLGVLRWVAIDNCLASVTGAKKNSIGGAIYL